ncbi:MAG: DUF4147 domain-containing protein [Woeseiaceae bacterium]
MNTLSQQSEKTILTQLFNIALDSVNGSKSVESYLQKKIIDGDVAVLAIGKASIEMMQGAKNVLKNQITSELTITKEGYTTQNHNKNIIEAGHPLPNDKSIHAGQRLIEFLKSIPHTSQFLALISGGASALAEVLSDGKSLDDLIKLNTRLLSSGLSIGEINQARQSLSKIKGGHALNFIQHKNIVQLLISDVKYDDISIIASGLFIDKNKKYNDIDVESHIIASNEMACQAVYNEATSLGYSVFYYGQSLYGDVFELAESIIEKLMRAKSGIHIWGGEPTIKLPTNPGRGGRNQSLALAIAAKISEYSKYTVLVAATDGSDGPTDDVGAIVDGLTIQQAVHLGNYQDYLDTANAGEYLSEAGVLLSTGPTGTNVMDLVIAIKK